MPAAIRFLFNIFIPYPKPPLIRFGGVQGSDIRAIAIENPLRQDDFKFLAKGETMC